MIKMAELGISLHSTICRNDDVVFSEVEGETVIMNVETGKYFNFTSVTSYIWDLMEHPVKVSEICSALLDKYNVSNEQCEKETLTVLNELLKEEIINICEQ